MNNKWIISLLSESLELLITSLGHAPPSVDQLPRYFSSAIVPWLTNWVMYHVKKLIFRMNPYRLQLTCPGGHLQGRFPLSELPWNLPAGPGIFSGPPTTFDGTSSIGDEFSRSKIVFHLTIVYITLPKWAIPSPPQWPTIYILATLL